MDGKHLHVTGSFRNYGKKLVNYGKAYAMNESGAYNEFVLHNVTANSELKETENETAGSGVTLDADSYFYIEKVQTI